MKKVITLAVAALSLSACASLVPPSTSEIAALPTIKYGQTAPADKNFILHYPAGMPLPMEMSITGNLFDKDETATLSPRLKRDVYVYKTWASFDGKTWQRGNQLIDGKIEFRLPGEADGRKPGMLGAEFNEK